MYVIFFHTLPESQRTLTSKHLKTSFSWHSLHSLVNLYLFENFQDDFMAIEMFDRKIRFVWNVGGGTGVVTHPEVLQVGSLADDKLWYRIEAER